MLNKILRLIIVSINLKLPSCLHYGSHRSQNTSGNLCMYAVFSCELRNKYVLSIGWISEGCESNKCILLDVNPSIVDVIVAVSIQFIHGYGHPHEYVRQNNQIFM